jgi:hypothetical protein
MKNVWARFACGLFLAGSAMGPASAQGTADLPEYLKSISGTTAPTPAALAAKNILQLNITMFELYDDAAQVFQRNILAKHPLILALFSGAGGRMILYRPGQPPLNAPSVPLVYQLLKSTGHSTMAISEVVMPYLNNATDQSWRGNMLAYRSRMKSAIDSADAMDMQADWKATTKAILENNLAYMDDCLAKNVITLDGLQAFARKQGPDIKKIVSWAAETQVKHWMGVLDEWQKLVGADWNKTYAASNTIYVTRQNNVLFSVLAQYMGPDAINDRLMLIETVSFITTPEDMLTSVTRIISDRSVGQLFFGNYHLMDYELMGGDARKTIISESAKRGRQPFLPPAVPFGSKQWPTLITPGQGATSLDDLH